MSLEKISLVLGRNLRNNIVLLYVNNNLHIIISRRLCTSQLIIGSCFTLSTIFPCYVCFKKRTLKLQCDYVVWCFSVGKMFACTAASFGSLAREDIWYFYNVQRAILRVRLL